VGIITTESNIYIVPVNDQIKNRNGYIVLVTCSPKIAMVPVFPLLFHPKTFNGYIGFVTCPSKKIETVTSSPLLVLPKN
jgi:hypothetical protein